MSSEFDFENFYDSLCPNCLRKKRFREQIDVVNDIVYKSIECYYCGHKVVKNGDI